jgi:hypothetical protein
MLRMAALVARMSVATPAARGSVCSRVGTRGGFVSRLVVCHGPRVVTTASAASSSAESTRVPISWGAPGARRDVGGDIKISEACLGPACWASSRGLDERTASDRLSRAFDTNVNFVDTGTPPDTGEFRLDARLGRWVRQSGVRREDLVVAGHVPKSAFSLRENDGATSLQVTKVSPKTAYRNVQNAVDKLLLSNQVEYIDILHVPWPECAPPAFQARGEVEVEIAKIARKFSTQNVTKKQSNQSEKKAQGVPDKAIALDCLEWQTSEPSGVWYPSRKGLAQFNKFERDDDELISLLRDAHLRAIADAVKSGKVRKVSVSFDDPWLACVLDLGPAAFYDVNEMVERRSVSAGNASGNSSGMSNQSGRNQSERNQSSRNLAIGDCVASVSTTVSLLRDPRRQKRLDDYETTLFERCSNFSGNETKEPNGKPLLARDVFFPNTDDKASLASKLHKVANEFGEFSKEDVALLMARSAGFIASVVLDSGSAVSSSSSNEFLDDDSFTNRLHSFSSLEMSDPQPNPELTQALLNTRLKHFKGASNAERGYGKGRGRGRDPFTETGDLMNEE